MLIKNIVSIAYLMVHLDPKRDKILRDQKLGTY